MNRNEKKEWVEGVHESFLGSEILLVVHYKGLTVAEMTTLRSQVREAGAGLKVTKNLLAKIALKGTKYEQLADLFTGPTAVAYANDPVAAAKVMADFAKNNEKLVLVGGAFGDTVLDINGIQALAKLPSLDELRAKIIAMLITPATRIAGVLQAPAGQLARVCGAYGAKDA